MTSYLELSQGVRIRADGLGFLSASRSLIAADIHLGYEEAIGGVLPLLGLAEIEAKLLRAVTEVDAEEIILLGDIVDTTALSLGAGLRIRAFLDRLRERTRLVCVAGNHEGRSRGRALLGETHESVDRAAWRLVHGDNGATANDTAGGRLPVILGHFHPSLHVAGRTIPVFVHDARTVILPALTPYSPGLDICSDQARDALRPWFGSGRSTRISACSTTAVRELGELRVLRRLGPHKTKVRTKR